jgi:hypothetical protein
MYFATLGELEALGEHLAIERIITLMDEQRTQDATAIAQEWGMDFEAEI